MRGNPEVAEREWECEPEQRMADIVIPAYDIEKAELDDPERYGYRGEYRDRSKDLKAF